MTFKDRTLEFSSFSEAARTKIARSPPLLPTKQKQVKSQFMQNASQIGRDIFEVSEKLNRLTKLAKKRGIFDDPSAEIDELTYIIKQDIQNLNGQITKLKTMSNGGSSSDQTSTHNKTVVGYLTNRLANTTKDFKEILQVRTETLKTQQERKQRFTGTSVLNGLVNNNGQNSSISNYAMKPSASESVLYKPSIMSLPESPSRGEGEIAISMPSSASMMMISNSTDYTSSRVNAVQRIEESISELQGIFQQLATLVSEQGELIERIDSNVDTSLAQVERGHNALLTNLINVMSSRKLILKIFAVLIVFIIVFVVFFV